MPENPSSESLLRLKASLDGALAGLESVENKRLFGCDGAFVAGNIFALVWKDGRLGLRLPDEALQAELLAEEGAGPWRMDGKAVKHWVLLPQRWHADARRLREWCRRAYALAQARPERRKVTGKGTAGTRNIKAAVFKRLRRQEPG
jgi:TfoX/Sxy family transcriptional regulator of competence genes